MVSPEVAAIAMMFAVHVVGAVVLVFGMFDGERPDLFRGWWPKDGDDGDEPPPAPPAPGRGPGGLPLPEDAQPARQRLREPGRIGEGGRRRGRPARDRPHREPQPQPAPPRVPDRDAP